MMEVLSIFDDIVANIIALQKVCHFSFMRVGTVLALYLSFYFNFKFNLDDKIERFFLMKGEVLPKGRKAIAALMFSDTMRIIHGGYYYDVC